LLANLFARAEESARREEKSPCNCQRENNPVHSPTMIVA
jgi:hypothetical protein